MVERTPIEFANIIVETYVEDVHHLRGWFRRTLEDWNEPEFDTARWKLTTEIPHLSGSSVESSRCVVTVHCSCDDPNSWGSFPASADARQLSVWINSHRPRTGASHDLEWIPLSKGEAEGWARAVLGPDWSDSAYLVHAQRNEHGRWPVLFVVFVDRNGQPLVVPDDFEWGQAGIGSPARPIGLTTSNS
ncbi:hypothetical protein [Rhodococcus sp. T7]|uniref:hypothetical protein n=1 Tax=Rhodococcus sp. T7 TaxID=627444 RepID=UPI00135CC5BB|nr:hypothetical protein [Rhodococcus sp. T7]KAF0957213.1 hypothetical protein MLGJGCBP_09043 [Rhodococcus sp. T7]KAF0966817.1 hypothetical protein MLGJGCBP_00012 [Rhodococcus sp. T7]